MSISWARAATDHLACGYCRAPLAAGAWHVRIGAARLVRCVACAERHGLEPPTSEQEPVVAPIAPPAPAPSFERVDAVARRTRWAFDVRAREAGEDG